MGDRHLHRGREWQKRIMFADSRRFAEDWTYRFLTTALTDASDLSGNG